MPRRRFLSNFANAQSLVGKEILFETRVNTSEENESKQIVLGKVEAVYRGRDGRPGLRIHNYRRTVQAIDNCNVPTDANGYAVRSYSSTNITRFLGVLSSKGMVTDIELLG